MSKYARDGAIIGTTIMPGGGTVVGAMTGGLIDLFSGPEAQQQQANIGGRSIDARQIWEQIHPGTADSLHEGAKAAGTLQSVHDNRAGLIDEINKAMDAAWQGNSSQQVQAGAHPLGIWLRDSASNLQKSGTYLNNQGEAFTSAHSKVQEIAATPPQEGLLDHINPFSDKDDEINKYNQQGQTNVQAFQDYYNASAQNAAGMPQYQAWQGNNFSEGQDHGKDPGTGGKNVGNLPPGVGGSFNPNTGNLGNTGKLPQYNAKIPTGTDPYGTGRDQGNPPNIGYKPPSWNDGTTAAGYTPSTSGTDFTSGFGPGGSSYGSGSGSGSGGGYGGGSFGAGGFGPGGSGSLGAGSSTGSGAAGAGSGMAGAGRGGVGAGAAGAGGRAGTSGMAGMGGAGGRGKGSDDEEHQSKYLVSEDPNELFGTDELTAPPVIGE